MSRPRVLSLFSGVGLHDLGLYRAGWEIAGCCEIDPWCRAVLGQRFPQAHLWEDVRALTADAVRDAIGRVDLISGGFPFQDISAAGKGAGLEGARSGLWFRMLELIEGIRPAWILTENSPVLRTRGVDRIIDGLEGAGYAVAPPVVVGARAVGAPHRRDRVWIAARRMDYAAGTRCQGLPGCKEARQVWDEERRAELTGSGGGRPGVGGLAHADSPGLRHEPGRRNGANREGPPESRAAGSGGLADANGLGREGERSRRLLNLERPALGHDVDGRDGAGLRWPARRGEPQHPWEAPRVVESGLGRAASGRSGRLDGFARRARLRALGNANPPYVPELIGRWMLQYDSDPGRVPGERIEA